MCHLKIKMLVIRHTLSIKKVVTEIQFNIEM